MKCEEYEALIQKAEDLEDALAMQKALASPEDEVVGLDDYERRRAALLGR